MKRYFVIWAVLATISGRSQHTDSIPNGEMERYKLGEVIVEGNRLDTPFSRATRDIQIITQRQIQAMPARSLNEVLSFISGVDVRQRGPFGTQTDISIDGGTSEQVLVMINGVKMLDAQTAHNMMNIPVPLHAIDHIEVIRGAAARIYGINALTGAINIVTKREHHSALTADLRASSSFKTKEEDDGSGIYGGGAVELMGIYGSEKQSQLFAVSQSQSNGQRYNSASKNTRLFYNGHYDLDTQHSLTAMAGYAHSLFGANGFYAAPNDRNAEELVKSSIFSISSKHQWGKFTLSPRISDRYGEDDYRFYKHDLNKGRSLHYTNALMLELNSSLETNIGAFGFGWESRLETITSSNIGAHNRENHGAFAEFRSHFAEKFRGSVGMYANYNTQFGWQIYPGMDMAYLVNDQWKISASVGSGQRIPSFADLYLDQRPGNIGNVALQPESAWNYEGNVQYMASGLQLKTGYFFRNISNFIDWTRTDTAQPYSPENFAGNKMHGLYVRIQHDVSVDDYQAVGYNISYNYLSPSMSETSEYQSKYVLESLKHQLIAGAHYRSGNFSVQVNNRWLRREEGKAYNVSDARIHYKWENLVVYSELTNIFDAQYQEAGAVPMPTRWFGIGLTYRWQE